MKKRTIKCSDEQGVQLLKDADGVEGTQRTGQQALMNFDLIQRDFDFPAFMVQHNQVQGRVARWVKQGGDQPMVLSVTGTLRLI